MTTLTAYTLDQWIKMMRQQVNVFSDFISKIALSDGQTAIFFYDEIALSKYDNELDQYITKCDLTDREAHFYQYNPRLLAYDLYGIPEFWYLILHANELHSAVDFHPEKSVRFYTPNVVSVLDEIRMLEQDRKNANEQEMTDIVVGKRSASVDIFKSSFIS